MAALLQDCIDGPASPEEDEVLAPGRRRVRLSLPMGDGEEKSVEELLEMATDEATHLILHPLVISKEIDEATETTL